MSRPDAGLIHMWLDGECSAEEAARVERLVAGDPAWAAAVAEARGLIAASSRIVSALDAVPAKVMPAGSKAAPELVASPARVLETRDVLRVRPWMKLAAGLVLVAGTAFAIRGTTGEVFGPRSEMQTAASGKTSAAAIDSAVTADATTSAASAASATSATSVANQASAQVGELASAPAAGAGVRSSARSSEPVAAKGAAAREETNARVAAVPPTAPIGPPAVEAPAPAARSLAEMERRFATRGVLSQVVTTGTRGAAPEQILDSPNLIAATGRLEECWNITAPDSLRTLLRNPTFLRGTADTLVLEFVFGEARQVNVVKNNDTLRGEITAKRVECPKP